jgi:hypothetical protein
MGMVSSLEREERGRRKEVSRGARGWHKGGTRGGNMGELHHEGSSVQVVHGSLFVAMLPAWGRREENRIEQKRRERKEKEERKEKKEKRKWEKSKPKNLWWKNKRQFMKLV